MEPFEPGTRVMLQDGATHALKEIDIDTYTTKLDKFGIIEGILDNKDICYRVCRNEPWYIVRFPICPFAFQIPHSMLVTVPSDAAALPSLEALVLTQD